MAFAHIHFNQSTQYGAKLRQLLDAMESSDDQLTDVVDLMTQMLDGDGSADAHYVEIAKRFAFVDYDVTTGGAPTAGQLAGAHAAYSELLSANAKTSGNGSVSNVRVARDQLYAKLRG